MFICNTQYVLCPVSFRLTAASLKDYAVVCSAKHKVTVTAGRRKRSATTRNAHVIIVDGPLEKLILCTETETKSTITLMDPANDVIVADTSFDKGEVYLVPNPLPGRWELSVSASSGHYRFTVKVLSDEKIDFAHDFVLLPQRRITRKEALIPHPLSGK